MSDRFKDRYRITSARKTNWDYSSEGMYHVTLCTGGRELYFGNVIEDKMVFSDIGYIANNYWLEIPEHFAFIQLDKFQVMPNHIHGILKIDHHLKNSKSPHLTPNTAKRVFVETLHATSLRRWMAQISPKKGSLSTVIRSFKSAVTKDARIINSEYHWQSRFHDSFIQDEQSLANIRAYIVNNPKNWHQDELNPEYKKTNKQNKKKK